MALCKAYPFKERGTGRELATCSLAGQESCFRLTSRPGGAGDWARTGGIQAGRSGVLFQNDFRARRSGGRGSNPRHPAWKASALRSPSGLGVEMSEYVAGARSTLLPMPYTVHLVPHVSTHWHRPPTVSGWVVTFVLSLRIVPAGTFVKRAPDLRQHSRPNPFKSIMSAIRNP